MVVQQSDVTVHCGRRLDNCELTSPQWPTTDDKPSDVEDTRNTSTEHSSDSSCDVTLTTDTELSELAKNMATETKPDISGLIELLEDITIEPNPEKKPRDGTDPVTDDNDDQVLARGLGDNAYPTAASDPRQLPSMQAASLQGQQFDERAVKCLRRSPAEAQQATYRSPPLNGGRSCQLPSCRYASGDVPLQRFNVQFGDCAGMATDRLLSTEELYRRSNWSNAQQQQQQQQQQQHSGVMISPAAPNIYTDSEVPYNFDSKNNIYSELSVSGFDRPGLVFQYPVTGNGISGLSSNDFRSVGLPPTLTPQFPLDVGNSSNWCPVGPSQSLPSPSAVSARQQHNIVLNGHQQFQQQQQQQFPLNVTATITSDLDLPELNDSVLDILQTPPATCNGNSHSTQQQQQPSLHVTRSPVQTSTATPSHLTPVTQYFETSLNGRHERQPNLSPQGLNSTSGVRSAPRVTQQFYQIPLYEGSAGLQQRRLTCSPLGQTSSSNSSSTVRNSPQSTHQNFQTTNSCQADIVAFSSSECQLVSPSFNYCPAASPHQFFQQTSDRQDAVSSVCCSPRQPVVNTNNNNNSNCFNYQQQQQQVPQSIQFLAPSSLTIPSTSSTQDLNRVRSQPNISHQFIPAVPSVRRVSFSSGAQQINNNYSHSPSHDACPPQQFYVPPSQTAFIQHEQFLNNNNNNGDQVDHSTGIDELLQLLHDDQLLNSVSADLCNQQQQLVDGFQGNDVSNEDTSSLTAPLSVATVDSIQFNTDSSSPPSRPPPSISVTSDDSTELLKELDQYISRVPPDTSFPFTATFGEINHVVSAEGCWRPAPPSTLELGARRSPDQLTVQDGGNMSVYSCGGSQVSPTSSVCSSSTLSSYRSTTDAVSPVEAVADDEMLKAVRRASLLSVDDLLHQNSDRDSPLHVALIHGEEGYATVLLHKYIEHNLVQEIIEMRNKMLQTPLCLAVLTNQSSIVRQLLVRGADVNAQLRSEQRTGVKYDQPIHYAASKGAEWLETLKILLTSPDIHINALNSEGRSPLHCAVDSHGKMTSRQTQTDSTRTIELLVEHGADLNLPDGSCERTPLHFAISRRDVSLVRLLLELASRRSSSASASSRGGAASHGSLESTMLSARTGTGNAALHLAVSLAMMAPSDKRRLVQLLLSKGADPSAKNADGQLPREMTTDIEIINLLKGQHTTTRRLVK